MPNNNKVLVVSEDPGLRRDLVTILEFLGEGPVAADDLSVAAQLQDGEGQPEGFSVAVLAGDGDRKSTRLNSSHVRISYAVFCLKKKTYQSDADHSTWTSR